MSDWKRFIVAFDTHGDQIDLEARKTFFKFVEDWKPDIRIGGGDHFDNRPIRRAATDDEKRESMAADFRSGYDFLEEYQPNNIVWGNHDLRLTDIAKAGRGPISDYAKEKVEQIDKLTRKLRCRCLPYDKRDGILQIGSLKIGHGFAHGLTAARRMAQAYGSILFGHIHAIHSASIEGLESRVGRACGCLCKLNPEYSRASLGTLVWRHGFPYGVVNIKTGIYFVYQAESIEGTWYLPSDFSFYKNKL